MADNYDQEYPSVQPGGTIGLYNPEGIDASPTPPVNPRTLIGQGVLMGWGDELEGWLKSTLSKTPYEEGRQRALADVKEYATKYPVNAAHQEFAGAAIPAAAASLFPPLEVAAAPRLVAPLLKLQRALAYNPEVGAVQRGVRTGAAYGTISGAGNAEPGSTLAGGLYGGVGGAGIGLAVPVIGSLIGRAGRYVAEDILGDPAKVFANKAKEKILQSVKDAGISLKDLVSMSKEDYQRLGIPSSIAHYLPETTEAVITKGGTKQVAKLEQKLASTQAGETKRVESKLKQALKPTDYYADQDALTATLRDNAKTVYDAAYLHGPVNDPEVLKFLDLPQFKQARKEAQILLEAEGRSVPLNTNTVEELDQVKRGLDRLIEKETDATTGKVTSLGRVYTNKKNEFLSALDAAVPEYGIARAQYAGDLEVKNALSMGKKEFNVLDPEQITQFMATASEAEKQAFRTGAMRHLQNTIFDRPNAAGRIVNSEKMNDKLRSMFDTSAEYDLVKAAIDKEALLYQRASKALTGSRTAIKQEAVKTLEKEPMSSDQYLKGKGDLIGLVTHFLHNDEKVAPEVIGNMAEMLSKGTPAEVAAVVRALEKREKVMNYKGKVVQATTQGVIAGTEGGTAIPTVGSDISGGDQLILELMNYWKSKDEAGKHATDGLIRR